MKSKDIHAMPVAELNDKLAELRKELMKLNAQVATGTTPKSPGQVRTVKRTIARILTELKHKEEGVNKA
jgi:large subunit ribosomal protein L29